MISNSVIDVLPYCSVGDGVIEKDLKNNDDRLDDFWSL